MRTVQCERFNSKKHIMLNLKQKMAAGCLLLAVPLLAGGAPADDTTPLVTVHPAPLVGALRNPLMGFRPYLNGFEKDPAADPWATVAQQYIKWNEIENGESDGSDKIRAYCEKTWKDLPAQGVKVVPRVYLRYTHDTESYWPADMTTGDYTSEQYKQRCLRLIARLGKLWDNDPRVAWIQMGMIGRWGEQHTPRPTPEQRVWLEKAFKDAFKHKQVVIRFPENWKDSGFGVYWDSFGGNGEIYNVNTYIPLTAIHEGEIAYDNAKGDPFGKNADETVTNPRYRANFIEKVRQTHALAVGWISNYSKTNAEALKGAAEIQAAFGYRFVLDSVSYPPTVGRGAALPMTFTVRNLGSASFPYQWPVEVSFLDAATHAPVCTETLRDSEADIRTWLPGNGWDAQTSTYQTPAPTVTVHHTLRLPRNLPAGRYVLALSILDPAGNVPAVRFAVANYWAGGRQPIGLVGVDVASSSPDLSPATFTDPNKDKLPYAGRRR